jgi:hypothetical protein
VSRLTPSEIEVCLTNEPKCVDKSLGNKLMAIHREYMGRCIYNGEPRVDKVKRALCIDEWTEARRIVVEGE